VDVGDKRIGIARGSSLARLAEPLKTVPATDAWEEIESLALQYGSSGVVVGLPRGLDGQETAQTKKVQDWVIQAKKQLKYSFYWQDEALTSHQAVAEGADSHIVDAQAAAIILQDFLDTPAAQRVRC
jgi:putative holliday junction resolvase